MARLFLLLAALGGLSGVALGAFGAHALSARMPPPLLDVFHTAVDYQLWHVASLLAVALLLQRSPDSLLLKLSGGFLVLGILLFSGSLYLMTLAGLKLGIVTPIGGVCLMLGWLCMGLFAWRLPARKA